MYTDVGTPSVVFDPLLLILTSALLPVTSFYAETLESTTTRTFDQETSVPSGQYLGAPRYADP
jgi:hypothetical protein